MYKPRSLLIIDELAGAEAWMRVNRASAGRRWWSPIDQETAIAPSNWQP